MARIKYQHVAGVKFPRSPPILTACGKLEEKEMIGAAIRNQRTRAGLTQESLAELVDLNPKYIGEVERGEKIISIEALLRVAKAVKVPILEFFRGV
jgi:DNA-binding XRE family transcriptional regulator